MSKTQMSPKFRRMSMIGVGIAGAFAIAVPSIAWAVDTSPSNEPVAVAVVDQEAQLTHEEICAQAPVDVSNLTPEELATLEPASEMGEAMLAEEFIPTPEELANSVPATGMGEAISC